MPLSYVMFCISWPACLDTPSINDTYLISNGKMGLWSESCVNFTQQCYNTAFGAKSVFQRSYVYWCGLPTDTKNAPSLNVSKKSAKLHYYPYQWPEKFPYMLIVLCYISPVWQIWFSILIYIYIYTKYTYTHIYIYISDCLLPLLPWNNK